MTRLLSVAVVLGWSTLALAQAKNVVEKVEAVFEPAEAKPGQTVTLKITVKLSDGYYTYPVSQPADEAKYSTNKLTFPADTGVLFVGETVDPVLPQSKKITEGGESYEMLYYPGGGTWLRRAVVLPTTKAGEISTKVKFKLLVCDKDNCFPPKMIDVEAKVKVLDGPAVPVEKRYQAEVDKATKK